MIWNMFMKSLAKLLAFVSDPTRMKGLVVGLILGAAFCIPGFQSAPTGLPYLHHYDEPLIINEAVNGLKRVNDDDPHTKFLPSSAQVVYGGYMRFTSMALDALYFQYLKLTDDEVLSWNDIKTDLDGTQTLTISHPGFFYWARIWHVIMGGMGVVFLFFLVRLRFGMASGVIAALILIGSHTYFAWSFIVTTNIPLSTWIIATFYFAVKFNHSKNRRYLVLSFIASGLAMSSKMTGAASILIPYTAALLNYSQLRAPTHLGSLWKVTYHGLMVVGVFLLWNPSVWLNNSHFMHWMRWLSALYKDGGPHFTKEPGWEHLSYQVGELASSFGWIGIISVMGIAFSIFHLKGLSKKPIPLRSSDALIMLVFPVVFLFYVTFKYKIAYHRNFLLLYPILAAFAAEGIFTALNWIQVKIKLLQKKGYHEILVSVAGALLFLLLWSNFKQIYRDAQYNNQVRDTRTKLMTELGQRAKGDSIFVGVENGLRVSMHDLKRLEGNYGYFSISELDSAFSAFTHLLVPQYDFPLEEVDSSVSILVPKINETVSARLEFQSQGSKINYLHDKAPWVPIVSPQINVLTGSSYPPRLMQQYVVPKVRLASVGIADHYPRSIYRGKLPEAEYYLSFELTGTIAAGELPTVSLLQEEDTLATINVKSTNWTPVKMVIKGNGEDMTNIQVIMLNDYYDAETEEDRNAYIRNLTLRRQTD